MSLTVHSQDQKRIELFEDKTTYLKSQLSHFLAQTIDEQLLRHIVSGDLKTLSLDGLRITENDLKVILSYCPKLTGCDLSECTELSEESLTHLSPKTLHLFLRSLPKLTVATPLYLTAFVSLKTVDLSEATFNLRHLKELKQLKRLETLYLWRCTQLTDEDLLWLEGRMMRHVDVSYCRQLTDRSLTTLKRVTKLSLDGLNYITNEGLSVLSASAHLREVSLYRCPLITPQGRRCFNPLRVRVTPSPKPQKISARL